MTSYNFTPFPAEYSLASVIPKSHPFSVFLPSFKTRTDRPKMRVSLAGFLKFGNSLALL